MKNNIKNNKKSFISFLMMLTMLNNTLFLSGCSEIKTSSSSLNSFSKSDDVKEEINLRKEFGGVMNVAYEKVTASLYETGNSYYVNGYNADNKDSWYAEPEFAGKYMYFCSILGGKFLDQAKPVVEKCIKAQREDGYLGCLPEGQELVNFSIWNQSFTILGLVEYYNATKDERALKCAMKCFDYVEDSLRKTNLITDSINGGSQHISILLPLANLYKASLDDKVLEFADYVIIKAEEEGFDLINFKNIFQQPSQKGIEMLVVYIGLAELANIINEDNQDYFSYSPSEIKDAIKRYWEQINLTQIRNSGGGTTGEWWRLGANEPANLSTDMAVNENCVSVGWCELTGLLFEGETNAKYLDAIEKTYFNAILGSLSTDGSDFAYYQGNYGKKEFATSGGMYKCCRTRGFNIIAELPNMMYKYDNDEITPIIYSENTYDLEEKLSITCQTDYPQSGKLKYVIKNDTGKTKVLKLRIPSWCKYFKCNKDYELKDSFVNVKVSSGETVIEFNLTMEVKVGEYTIDGIKHHDFNYGPLLLVHDRSNGVMLKDVIYNSNNGIPSMVENDKWNKWDSNNEGSWYLVQFTSGNLNLVDYASAGRADPKNHLFKTYIKGE